MSTASSDPSLKGLELWYLTGSQNLYGAETLKQVAADAQAVVRALNDGKRLPVRLVAKGVLTRPDQLHICYCHTPMRYVWDMYHRYRAAPGMGAIARLVFSLSAHYMRLWDYAAAARVDYFVANSRNVAGRIGKHYRREATVIHPPVAVCTGYISPTVEDYYLVVGQLVDYKRVDLAIEACNRLGRPLRIIGEGDEFERLRRLAGVVQRIAHAGP
jgi:glycosyltransferase involved in cell wall biosynthesis